MVSKVQVCKYLSLFNWHFTEAFPIFKGHWSFTFCGFGTIAGAQFLFVTVVCHVQYIFEMTNNRKWLPSQSAWPNFFDWSEYSYIYCLKSQTLAINPLCKIFLAVVKDRRKRIHIYVSILYLEDFSWEQKSMLCDFCRLFGKKLTDWHCMGHQGISW